MAQQDIDEAYAVTDDGRVWSNKTNKWLRYGTSSNGYRNVRLHGKVHSIHRLVAKAFCSNPDCKPYVNHIDGNKTNNNADNLEWVTASENSRHAVENGLQVPSEKQKQVASAQAFKMGMANRNITMDEARQIRTRRNNGEMLKSLANEYGVSLAVASNIVRNISYKEAV